MVRIISLLFGLILISGLGFLLMRDIILRTNSPIGLRVLLQMIAPPKDYFRELVREDIDILDVNGARRFEFKNKYAGLHDVGIILKRFSSELYFKQTQSEYKPHIKCEVNFYSNNLLLLHKVVDTMSPFMGQDEGYTLSIYKSPQELPLGKLIRCELKILETDKDFFQKYGSTQFFIRKLSDE